MVNKSFAKGAEPGVATGVAGEYGEFWCPFCVMRRRWARDLTQHIKKVHPDEYQPPTGIHLDIRDAVFPDNATRQAWSLHRVRAYQAELAAAPEDAKITLPSWDNQYWPAGANPPVMLNHHLRNGRLINREWGRNKKSGAKKAKKQHDTDDEDDVANKVYVKDQGGDYSDVSGGSIAADAQTAGQSGGNKRKRRVAVPEDEDEHEDEDEELSQSGKHGPGCAPTRRGGNGRFARNKRVDDEEFPISKSTGRSSNISAPYDSSAPRIVNTPDRSSTLRHLSSPTIGNNSSVDTPGRGNVSSSPYNFGSYTYPAPNSGGFNRFQRDQVALEEAGYDTPHVGHSSLKTPSPMPGSGFNVPAAPSSPQFNGKSTAAEFLGIGVYDQPPASYVEPDEFNRTYERYNKSDTEAFIHTKLLRDGFDPALREQRDMGFIPNRGTPANPPLLWDPTTSDGPYDARGYNVRGFNSDGFNAAGYNASGFRGPSHPDRFTGNTAYHAPAGFRGPKPPSRSSGNTAY